MRIRRQERYPDELAIEALRSSFLLPQQFTGVTLIAGNAAVRRVLNGENSWEEVAYGRTSKQQISMAFERRRRAHKVYGIPWERPNNWARRLEDYMDMRYALWAGRGNVRKLAAKLGRTVTGRRISSRELFSPGPSGFRPEAVAVAGIWGVAADALQSDAGVQLCKETREGISRAYASKMMEERHVALLGLVGVHHSIRRLVAGAIRSQLSAMAEACGQEIPSSVIGVVDGYVKPAAHAGALVNRSS